jgi:hypothetical protein
MKESLPNETNVTISDATIEAIRQLENRAVCVHDPLSKANTLIFESSWIGGRIRCTECGEAAFVTGRGLVRP